jgi:hypothetical protein
MEIITNKIAENKVDSFWYDGTIAVKERPDGSKLYARATGEIRVCFEEDADQSFKDSEAVQEATRRGLVDDDLIAIGEFDGFGNNNWFVVEEVDADGNYVDDLSIQDDYDSIINALKEL